MNEQELSQKETSITSSYQDFLAKVREAFNTHCEEIKNDATKKFEAIPEEDEDGRRKVLEEQKAELDKALAELKQLLAKRGSEVRQKLEEIANLKDQGDFNLDSALDDVSADEKQHVA